MHLPINCKIKMWGDRTEYSVSHFGESTITLTGWDCGWPYDAKYTFGDALGKIKSGEWEVIHGE